MLVFIDVDADTNGQQSRILLVKLNIDGTKCKANIIVFFKKHQKKKRKKKNAWLMV